jgi:hypothetical protein
VADEARDNIDVTGEAARHQTGRNEQIHVHDFSALDDHGHLQVVRNVGVDQQIVRNGERATDGEFRSLPEAPVPALQIGPDLFDSCAQSTFYVAMLTTNRLQYKPGNHRSVGLTIWNPLCWLASSIPPSLIDKARVRKYSQPTTLYKDDTLIFGSSSHKFMIFDFMDFVAFVSIPTSTF